MKSGDDYVGGVFRIINVSVDLITKTTNKPAEALIIKPCGWWHSFTLTVASSLLGIFYLVTPNLWQISRVAVDWLSV